MVAGLEGASVFHVVWVSSLEGLAVSTLFGLLVWRGRLFRSSFINVALVVWMGPLLYLVWVGGLEGWAFSCCWFGGAACFI